MTHEAYVTICVCCECSQPMLIHSEWDGTRYKPISLYCSTSTCSHFQKHYKIPTIPLEKYDADKREV